MRFYKKSDLQIDLQGKIPYFEDYSIEDRFLVFDLIDYGNIGIVNTFNEENRNKIKYSERESENSDSLSLKLIDFFNPQKILPDESIQLTLRHVAHLGIKSFVSSVVRNGGYFSIETNKNKKQKERLESLNGTIADSVDVFGSDGTIYQVVLPVKKRILPIPAPINRYKRIIHKEHQNDFLINSLIFNSTEITVDTIKNTIINDKNDQEKFIGISNIIKYVESHALASK